MKERCTNQTKPEYFTKLKGIVSSSQKVLFQLVRIAQIIDPGLESFVTRDPIWFNLGNGYQGTCDSFFAGARTHSRNGNPREAGTRAINFFHYALAKQTSARSSLTGREKIGRSLRATLLAIAGQNYDWDLRRVSSAILLQHAP